MLKENLTDALKAEYTRVAYYYYKMALTQDQISKKMQMSRQRVNRILKECVDRGIVKINIEGIKNAYYELEASLEQKFGIMTVRVTESCEPENFQTTLGVTAGAYLADILEPGDIIGFSRGLSISGLVDNMPSISKKNLVATGLLGGWNHAESSTNVDDIIHRFSGKTGAVAQMLFAPVIVNSPDFKYSIMSELYFQEIYKVIKSCTIAVVGIGGMVSAEQKPDEHFSEIEDEVFKSYNEHNAVGEICTHFFDASGNPVRTPMDDRLIAISLEDYLQIPRRIGVAGTPKKLQAIIGALRGGYINVLITDLDTAETLNRI